MAERLVNEGLIGYLMRFVVGGSHVAQELFLESVRTWTVCASYGLGTHAFPSIFPHLLAYTSPSLTDTVALCRSTVVVSLFRALTTAAARSLVLIFLACCLLLSA